MNKEKIIELVKIFKNANYKDFFAALVINEEIDYLHELENINEGDIEYLEKLYDYYVESNYSGIINNDMIEDLKYEMKEEEKNA